MSASTARATISLVLTDKDVTPTVGTVARGNTFPLTVNLSSSSTATANQVVSIDYFLNASTSGVFTIVSRNTTTNSSAFPLTISSDSQVVSAGDAPQLSPKNGTDLGGSVSNSNNPVSGGTFTVADYVIAVAANALPGNYVITTVSNAGTGYTGPGTGGNDATLSAQGTYTITVTTPEPATALLALPLAAIALMRSRKNP